MTSPARAALFWGGFGWNIAELATDQEVAGPFATLDEAWVEAKARGYVVTEVLRTRGTFKHPKPIPHFHEPADARD